MLSSEQREWLAKLGLEITSTYDTETERVYWHVVGGSTNGVITYHNSELDAFNNLVNPPTRWPSKEMMLMYQHMREVFHRISLERRR